MKRLGLAILGVILLAGVGYRPQAAAQAVKAVKAVKAEGAELFTLHIKPILEARCLACHNSQLKKGDFSLAGAGEFARSGIVKAGDADASKIMKMISGLTPKMPKDDDPLSQEQIGLIRKWIDAGAPWPDGEKLEDKKVIDGNFWSLKPVVKPPVPIQETGRTENGIDHFILARLKQMGLKASEPADRRTLIRRLYFDLLGLPPEPLDIDRFVADEAPDAYERLVDRLLASPRYGERWARHWLDVVHYGDTHGYDKDHRRPNAWPYRDYVVRAMNTDKPYGRFVREQVAGDILWPNDSDAIAATGFISAGPWDQVGQTEVAEGTIDKKIVRNLDRDDMVSSTMMSFASTTVQCARCHNHKFDPITQEEYYGLQAIFAGIERTERNYPGDPATLRLARRIEQRRDAQSRELAALRGKLESIKTPEIREAEKQIALTKASLEKLPMIPEGKRGQTASLGYHSAIMPAQNHEKWVQVDFGRVMPIDRIFLLASNVNYGGHPGPGFGFPHRFKVELSETEDFKKPILLADHTGEDFPNPGDAPVGIPGAANKGRYLRVTATRLWERTSDWIFALSELVAISDGVNVAAGARVTALDSIEAAPSWSRRNLVDGSFGLLTMSQIAGNAAASPTNGYHSFIEQSADSTKWVQIDLGHSQPIDRIRLIPARPTDFRDAPGFGFPVRYKVELSDNAEFQSARTIADHTAADFPNPGDKAVELDAGGHTARFVRLTATRLWERSKDYALALAEMQVQSGGRNIARSAKVTALDSIDAGRWEKRNLVDGYSSRGSLETTTSNLFESFSLRMEADQKIRQLQQYVQKMISGRVDPALLKSIETAEGTIRSMDEELTGLRSRQRVYAGVGGRAPRPVHLLARGSEASEVRPVEPLTIRAVPGLDDAFKITKPADEGDRRRALADWLADERQTLTHRSIVNRLWHYHFGQGIVATPNDFGRAGARPSHPELLDWLTTGFIENDQSLKWLHRLIVTSATYRQQSTDDAANAAVDGQNKYLWRFNRKRLEAESIRDAVLSVTGAMDFRMGGPGYDLFEYRHDHSPDYFYHLYNVDDRTTWRRSVYRFIVRSVPDPFMETLDCADPSLNVPARTETITPLAALSLLNNRFMVRQSEHLADQLKAAGDDSRRRMMAGFERVTGRPPVEAEIRLLADYADRFGLPAACRLLLNLNEFVFVD